MAYRLDPGEPTAAGLRRVLAEQLDASVSALRVPGGPDAEAVHDVRKRLKKARSALRLARGDLGAAVARQANAELRDVGQALSAQRDADALVETVDRLLDVARSIHAAADRAPADDAPAADAPAENAATTGASATDAQASSVPASSVLPASAGATTLAALERARGLLVGEAAAGRAGAATTTGFAGAARRLERTARWLALVPPRAEGWAALKPGLRRQYRKGRDALAGLGEQPSDEQLHEWRKRGKDLWYHLRLMRDAWPKALKPLVAAASELAGVLGDDHDLAMLRTRLVDQAALGDQRDLVVHLVDRERAKLQAQAREIGARLYAEPANAWAGHLGAIWPLAARASAPAAPASSG